MILEQARQRLREIAARHRIGGQDVVITCKTLTPEEAIGNPLHDDYPLQRGKERLIEADFLGAKGQAFSDSCGPYRGQVRDLFALNLDTNARRAIFVAALNAILAKLEGMPPAVHCRDEALLSCGDHLRQRLAQGAWPAERVLLVGLQPRLLEALTARAAVRVCDLDRDHIGTTRHGVAIDGPERLSEHARWAGALLATGSAVVNGTIDGLLAAHGNIFFYGVTITGVARLLGLRQFCPAAGKERL